jgi:hypothetical protein
MRELNIEELVADLKPVRRVSPADALVLVLACTAISITIIVMRFGLRPDVWAGDPHPLLVIRSGILLILGAAALAAVFAAARPGVGQASHGWRWALLSASLFPVSSICISVMQGRLPMADLTAASGVWCLGINGASGLLIGAVLTVWLRRGAPTSLERSGWLVGLAAGAFGTFAYSLHCPSTSIHYIGIWYTLAISLCSGFGRLLVPRVVRW